MHEKQRPLRDECVDPELGQQVWRLDDPDVAETLRRRIEAHVAFCAVCRLDRAVQETVAQGLQNGTLTLPSNIRRLRAWRSAATATSVAALAASLLLVLLPAPRATNHRQILRSEVDEPTILRPVADEVVTGRRPELRWTQLPPASAYQICVQSVDGSYTWTTEAAEPRLRIPADQPLPRGTRFRVFVEPVPAYLAPPGGLRSSFRTGNLLEFVAFRLSVASWTVLALGLVGMLGLLGLAMNRLRRSGTAGATR